MICSRKGWELGGPLRRPASQRPCLREQILTQQTHPLDSEDEGLRDSQALRESQGPNSQSQIDTAGPRDVHTCTEVAARQLIQKLSVTHWTYTS